MWAGGDARAITSPCDGRRTIKSRQGNRRDVCLALRDSVNVDGMADGMHALAAADCGQAMTVNIRDRVRVF